MYTGNNLDNEDKEKLILMLQVRQVISLVTSHPYLQKIFLGFISFVNKVIPMQQCCFDYPKLRD